MMMMGGGGGGGSCLSPPPTPRIMFTCVRGLYLKLCIVVLGQREASHDLDCCVSYSDLWFRAGTISW